MLFDPTRRWALRGLCRDEPASLFLAELTGRQAEGTVRKSWEEAKQVCAHCPVMAECRRDSLGERYGVWGGLDPQERRTERKRLPAAAKRWPVEKRLAWGKELSALESGGVIWRRISEMTGFGPTLGQQLAREWRAHVRSLHKPKAPAVALAERPKKPFPERPGKKTAWVRDGSIMRDAYYKGETHDGLWIRVGFRSTRETTYKWVPAVDVKQYHPQPKVIETYIRRPDREEGSAIA
ncbi:WhiB family transcriptional regulator [Streptomyces sp. t39]|uniref:WhiB family transcriptional regulator n=1 Tax=Streptomyces sp. t39 TaxID=1828156 RepID=UPI0011CD439C|nr:WhiB family transcriptional regulator [Streptomyces sp. t39]